MARTKKTEIASESTVESSKKGYVLTKEEQETAIVTNKALDYWEVYTCDKTLMKRLDSFVAKIPSIFSVIHEDEWSKTYKVKNKKLISIRAPRTTSKKAQDALEKNQYKLKDTK